MRLPERKAITCKRLAVIGGKDAIPALARLLPDQELSSWARIPLEVIEDPAADAALRDAATQLEGRLLIGVINSIAVRRDPQAVPILVPKLRDPDLGVAAAAALALGRIGDAQAVDELTTMLGDDRPAARSAAARGLVLAAEQRLTANQADEAATIYERVRQANVPLQRILEATRGAILARGNDGIDLLVESLQASEQQLFGIAVRTAGEIKGPEITEVLVSQLSDTAADRQLVLIYALSDRDDEAVLPAILLAARTGSPAARAAALEVLQRVGDATALPTLLDAAIDADPQVAEAARETLANLADAHVDARIAERLPQARGQLRQVLIELVGQRRIEQAQPELLAALEDPQARIRMAALTSLGATVDLDGLGVLIANVVTPKSPADAAAAAKALLTACVRMPDREACARQLTAALPDASLTANRVLLEVLGAVGGRVALDTLAQASQAANPDIRNTATRVLGEWMTADAAPVLLEIARTDALPRYRNRAWRGYLRIARQFSMPPAERARLISDALSLARPAEDKLPVFEILTRYPSIETLQVALAAARDSELETAANQAALAIAQKLGTDSEQVRKLLAQAGQRPVKIEILEATYGTSEQARDVTAQLKQHVGEFPLIILPGSYNNSLGGDPLPGVVKMLKIRYRVDGREGSAAFEENAPIVLR